MKKLILTIVFASMAIIGYCQINVYIEDNSEDSVGRILVSSFRENIRRSSNYQITYNKNEPHFYIKIDTMDRFKGDIYSENVSTMYNYTILINLYSLNIYMFNQMGYAGRTVIHNASEEIFSYMDSYIETFIQLLSEMVDE